MINRHIPPEIMALRKNTIQKKEDTIHNTITTIQILANQNTPMIYPMIDPRVQSQVQLEVQPQVKPQAQPEAQVKPEVKPEVKPNTPRNNPAISRIHPVSYISYLNSPQYIVPGNYVSVTLTCGIGNRIFQVLAALGYSEKFQKICVISRSNISNGAQPHEQNLDTMISTIFPNVNFVYSLQNLTVINEYAGFTYTPLMNCITNALLTGYFQNENYFPSTKEIPLLKTASYENTYFIHIRAGDYIGSPIFNHNLSLYYSNCIKILGPNVRYIVFSNDNTYATNYMKQFNIDYVLSDKTDQLEILIEMANCEGGICANSSFSWLGAFFQDKTVGTRFMPSVWVRGSDYAGVYPRWATVVDIYHYAMPCKIYDIFIKNNNIYLISTYVSPNDIYVSISINNTELSEFSKKEYEPLRYFYGPLPDSNTITIKLNYNLYKIINVKDIEHIKPLENKYKLAFASLFKDDYSFIKATVNHYRKQGVDCFYFYYNGAILPDGLFQGPDIIYKTWDVQPYMYPLGGPNFIHNAQTAFLAMFQQKHFNNNEYVILADLDEFIIPYNTKLTLLDKVNSLDKDVIKVKNHWAKLNENTITYSSSASDSFHRRKCIYKGSYTKPIGIHGPKDNVMYDCTDLRMLHANNIRHPEREREMYEPLETYLL